MDWTGLDENADRVALGKSLIDVTAVHGWNRRALALASDAGLSDCSAWRTVFPRGAVDAIWHISLISDADMQRAFGEWPADDLAAVVVERLRQNGELKPFVRRVMAFDIRHPVQALGRMQRTANVMFRCLGPQTLPPSFADLTVLNLIYTAIAFFWLFDRSLGDARTRSLAAQATRLVRIRRRPAR